MLLGFMDSAAFAWAIRGREIVDCHHTLQVI
jgi:hypothetical protein